MSTPRITLDTRASWAETQARLEATARAWHGAGCPDDQLLHGHTLRVVERWLQLRRHGAHPPSRQLHIYCERSLRRHRIRHRRRLLSVLGLVLASSCVAVGLRHRDAVGALLNPAPQPVAQRPVADTKPPPRSLRPQVDALFEVEDPTQRLTLAVGLLRDAEAARTPLDEAALWDLQHRVHDDLSLQSSIALKPPGNATTAVAFSSDGRRVALGSERGTIELWTLHELHAGPVKLRGHIDPVHALAFSPDGSVLVSGGTGDVAFVWSLDSSDASGTRVRLPYQGTTIETMTWHPHGDVLWALDGRGNLEAFAFDGAVATSAGAASNPAEHTPLRLQSRPKRSARLWTQAPNGRIRGWTASTRGHLEPHCRLDADVSTSAGFDLSADGRLAATATQAGQLRVWHLDRACAREDRSRPRAQMRRKPAAFVELQPEGPPLEHVAFSPDGHWLVAATGSDLRVWNLEDRDPSVASVRLRGEPGDISALAVGPGGVAVSGTVTGSVTVWDLEDSQRTVDRTTFDGHADTVDSIALDAAGRRALSVAADGSVRHWDVPRRKAGQSAVVERVDRGPVHGLVEAPSGSVLALGSRRARLFAAAGGDVNPAWPIALHEGLRIRSGAVSPAGDVLALGTEAGHIQLWRRGETKPRPLGQHAGAVNGLAFLPDERLLSAGSDGAVTVWTPGNDRTHESRTLHADEVHHLVVDRAGASAITASLDGVVLQWNLDDGTVTPLPARSVEVTAMELSPNERWLGVGHADGRVAVVDLEGTRVETVLPQHEGAVRALAFGGDRWLATAASGERVHVWDAEASLPFERAHRFEGHQQRTTALAVSSEHELVISGTATGSIHVWSLRSGRALQLDQHDDLVSDLAFSVDGTSLLSSSYDGTVRRWPLALGALAQQVCRALAGPADRGTATSSCPRRPITRHR